MSSRDFIMDFHGNEYETFIGELYIVYDLLGAMMKNSIEAGANRFHFDISISDESDHVMLSVSDNGNSVSPDIEKIILRKGCTIKANASGLTLFFCRAVNGKDQRHSILYRKRYWGGKGASFCIALLREMPEV